MIAEGEINICRSEPLASLRNIAANMVEKSATHWQTAVVARQPTVICLTAAIMFLCAQDFPGAPWVWQQAHRHPCVASRQRSLPPTPSWPSPVLPVSRAAPCPAARRGTVSALGCLAAGLCGPMCAHGDSRVHSRRGLRPRAH